MEDKLFEALKLNENSGVQTEQAAFYEEIEDRKEAIAHLKEVISQEASNPDRDDANEKILTAEVAKFQADEDYFNAKIDLIDKIKDVKGDEIYLALPNKN